MKQAFRLAALLGLAAVFGVAAAERVPWTQPTLRQLLAAPERWKDKRIRLSVAARAEEEVEADGLRLRVSGTRLRPGEDVELSGYYRGGVFDVRGARRRTSDLVPALLAIWALWTFPRRFRVRR
jgi:hypothetical protein